MCNWSLSAAVAQSHIGWWKGSQHVATCPRALQKALVDHQKAEHASEHQLQPIDLSDFDQSMWWSRTWSLPPKGMFANWRVPHSSGSMPTASNVAKCCQHGRPFSEIKQLIETVPQCATSNVLHSQLYYILLCFGMASQCFVSCLLHLTAFVRGCCLPCRVSWPMSNPSWHIIASSMLDIVWFFFMPTTWIYQYCSARNLIWGLCYQTVWLQTLSCLLTTSRHVNWPMHSALVSSLRVLMSHFPIEYKCAVHTLIELGRLNSKELVFYTM